MSLSAHVAATHWCSRKFSLFASSPPRDNRPCVWFFASLQLAAAGPRLSVQQLHVQWLSLHRHAQRRRSSTQRSMDCDADDRRDPSPRSSGHRSTVQRAQRSHPSLSSHPSPSPTNLHPSRRLWWTAHQTHRRRHPFLPLTQPASLHPLPHPSPRRTVYSWSPHHRRPRPDPPSRQTSTACPWYTCNVFPRPVKRSSTLPNPPRPVKRYSTSQLSEQASRHSRSMPASSRTTCSARCCTPASRSFTPLRTQSRLSQKEKKTKKIARPSLLPCLQSLTWPLSDSYTRTNPHRHTLSLFTITLASFTLLSFRKGKMSWSLLVAC